MSLTELIIYLIGFNAGYVDSSDVSANVILLLLGILGISVHLYPAQSYYLINQEVFMKEYINPEISHTAHISHSYSIAFITPEMTSSLLLIQGFYCICPILRFLSF